MEKEFEEEQVILSLNEEIEMGRLESFLEIFVERSRIILENNLEGIYLHGSAAMGCFNAKKSDIDLLIVVKNTVPDEIKKQYMDMVVEMNHYAPEKGCMSSFCLSYTI